MKNNEVIEKIESGTIRIENGRLLGLGISGSISIDALDELLDYMDKSDIIGAISDTITGIARIQSAAISRDESDNKELKIFVNNELKPIFQSIDILCLNFILKTFNS